MRTFIAFGLLLCACGSGSSDSAGGAGSGSGACPALGGTWTIQTHCVSSFVGQSVTIMQSGCTLSLAAPFDGYSGTVSGDGKLEVMGPTASGTQQCTGTASSNSLSLACPGPCAVTLGR